jgi:lipopolysaccharide export system protein LptA
MRLHLKYFLVVLILIASGGKIAVAQKTTKVKLIRSDELLIDDRFSKDLQRLLGNVVMLHDSTWFYCDSAWLNNKSNNFRAFSRVHINVSDTLDIYGDSLNYDGGTKIADIWGNVKLIDNRATLTTDHLTYDRNTRIAYYYNGATIVSDTNVLTSRIGHYYTDYKEAYFREEVVLTNPDYVMRSDTLKYNTQNKTAWFFGPSTIVGEKDSIYCEDGWYNTDIDVSRLKQEVFIQHGEQMIWADTVFYRRNPEYGLAENNVTMYDTVQNLYIKGNMAEYDDELGYAYVTDSALTIMPDKKDSLYLHADTMWMFTDSTGAASLMKAYYKVKYYRRDLQGMCDSLVYHFPDSTIIMYNGPVLWSEENQLTSDSVKIVIANNQIDTMVFHNSCFIVSLDDSLNTTYNQVKGRTMIGYFQDNEIVKIRVTGNAETIYFLREDDRALIGIQKAIANRMIIFLDSSRITGLTYIDKPDGAIYTPFELTQEELILRDFRWIEGRRPMRKEDIFVW